MKVLLAQHNPVIGDLEGNTAKALATIRAAQKQGVDLIVFPELSLCGYAPDDLLLHKQFIERMNGCLHKLVKASKGIAFLVGLARYNPEVGDKGLLNSAAMISDGKLVGFYDKWLLPTYDVFNERRYFARGQKLGLFEIKGKLIGVTICEDIWQNVGPEISGVTYPWDPIKELAPYKPDLLCNLSASPYQFGKPDVRVQVCRAVVEKLHVPIVYCCQVGANGALVFDGGSLVLDKSGDILAQGSFFQEEDLLVDLDKARPIDPPRIPHMQMLQEALELGVSDYFAKARVKKAVVGISGGIDSALVATIAAYALGSENVTGLFLPSDQSDERQKKDAAALAKNLKIKLVTLPIDAICKDFFAKIEPVFKEEDLEHTKDNIESRVRATLLMAFANQMNALLLNTTNKTEYALGECTLYGEMSGTISVIGDLLKTQVYELADWINRAGKIIPAKTIERSSSVILRRKKQGDKILSCDLIDGIIKGYVEEYQTVDEIAGKLSIDKALVVQTIEKIHRAEHKRRQSAPSLRVSSKAFGAGRHKPLHSRYYSS